MDPDTFLVFQRPAPLPPSIQRPTRMAGAMPAIKQLAVDRGYIVKQSNTAAAVTHLTYGGLYGMGKLAVPPGEGLRTFAQALCRDFVAGWVSAITENKPAGAPMRFYLDYDVEGAEYPSEEAWRQLEQVEKQELGRFFSDRPGTDPIFSSTVATSGVLDITAPDGSRLFKSGIHVYYPNLFVTVEMALYITTAILSAAKKRWPKAEGVWEKQIDQKVYAEKRGLRWVYQGKAKVCERCKDVKRPGGSRRVWCDDCDGSGQVVDLNASMYAPLYRVDGTYKRVPIVPACRTAPTPDLLLECSIMAVFAPAPTAGFVLYPGAEPKPSLKSSSKTVTLVTGGDAQVRASLKSGVAEQVPHGSLLHQAIQAAVRRLNPLYQHVDVRQALKFSSTTKSVFYRVYVSGKGSGYCLNIGRDHHSVRVYFLFLKSGIRQKCCCECATAEGRVSGKPCKQYESASYPITAEDDRLLFNSADARHHVVAASSTRGSMKRPAPGATGAPRSSTDVVAFSPSVITTDFVKNFRSRWKSFDDRTKPTGPSFSFY